MGAGGARRTSGSERRVAPPAPLPLPIVVAIEATATVYLADGRQIECRRTSEGAARADALKAAWREMGVPLNV